MNLLQIAQRLRLEVGASGNDSTVVDASGEWLRLVTWSIQAWEDIQRARDNWMWMRKTASFNTVAGQGEYPYASAPLSLTDFAHWFHGTFRVYENTPDDELFLSELNYEDFRNAYLYGTTRSTTGYPTVIAVSPSKSLILSLLPEKNNYVVSGDYYRAPSVLADNDDTPEMPERFHMAIVYKAMMMVGGYESAHEVYSRGESSYKKMLMQLEIDQLPPLVIRRNF